MTSWDVENAGYYVYNKSPLVYVGSPKDVRWCIWGVRITEFNGILFLLTISFILLIGTFIISFNNF